MNDLSLNEINTFQIVASIISSVRHCKPCAAWRSNPAKLVKLINAWDCFVARNDEKTKNDLMTKIFQLIAIALLVAKNLELNILPAA